MRKTKSKNRLKTAQQAMYGLEPKVAHIQNESQLVGILNWYSANYPKHRGLPWLVEWMKNNAYTKQAIEAVKENEIKISLTARWLARLANNGTKLFEHNYEFIKKSINPYLVSKEKEPEVIAVDKTSERVMNCIGDIEHLIDTQADKINLYSYLQGTSVPKNYAEKIIQYYQPKLDELKSVTVKTEGFEKYTKQELASLVRIYESIINDSNSYREVKKAIRKPRKKKVKPVESLVTKVQYLKESKEYKIGSVDPVKIIGAQTLWVFNTKYRKLGVYHASGEEGLSVKGTTVTGFDPKLSLEKTLRKPLEWLPKVIGGGKVALRKLLDEVNVTPVQLSGRINNFVILLRVL